MSRSFNGSTQFLRGPAVLTAPPLTLSCRVNVAGSGMGSIMGLYAGASSGLGRFFDLWRNSTALAARQGGPGGVTTAVNTVGLHAGTWSHVAGVFAGGPVGGILTTAYVDGRPGGVQNAFWTAATLDRTSVGVQDTLTPIYYFSGDVADCAVWNIALAAADIAALAGGADPQTVQPQALVGYWPLNGSSPEPDLVNVNGSLNVFGF